MIFDIYEQGDLFKIAGCSRRDLLLDWLRDTRIPFSYNAKGKVIAHKQAVDAALGVTTPTTTDSSEIVLGQLKKPADAQKEKQGKRRIA